MAIMVPLQNPQRRHAKPSNGAMPMMHRSSTSAATEYPRPFSRQPDDAPNRFIGRADAGTRAFYLAAVLIACTLLSWPLSSAADSFSTQREQLIQHITPDIQATRAAIDGAPVNPRVIEALRAVPRHAFVPAVQQRHAYENRPLPIGHGQTISQPFIVMLMTDLLDLQPTDRVLEIGTGSGYQAAVLAEMVHEVYSIEIIAALAQQSDKTLREQGYDRVVRKMGDGYYGWPEHGPYDAIMVTAGAAHIPPPLVSQLKPGGRMIIPVGSRFQVQQLVMVKKAEDGTVTTRPILPVRFVPLTGGP